MEENEANEVLQQRKGVAERLQNFSAKVHRGIGCYFGWHGTFVSQRPWMVIVACLLMAMSFFFVYYSIEEKELDSKKLFTPQTAQSFKDKEVYEDLYGIPSSQTRILITRKVDLSHETDCGKRSLLSETEMARRYLLEILSLFDEIRALRIEYKNEIYTLDDLCVRTQPGGPCRVMSVLSAWNYSSEALLADPDPIQTLQGDSVDEHRQSSTSYLLGASRDVQHCPGNIEAIQSWIILNYQPERIDGTTYDPRNRKWNRRLVRFLLEEWESDDLSGFVSNLDAVDMESEKTLEKDQRLLWLSYAMVLIYCHVVLFKNSCAQCKSHLAIISCLSVVMAIYSAYGLAQIFGIKYNPVHRVLPFLLMGLGVDDTFVIMSAYHDTDASMSVAERMRMTSVRAGSSILVTSVTDFVAFLSGTFTTLVALRDFSIYAAVGILFDFVYQITFFLAFLALDARREQRRYNRFVAEEEPLLNGSHQNGMVNGCDSDEQCSRYHEKMSDTSSEEQSETLMINGSARKLRIPDRKLIGNGNYIASPSFASRLVGRWMPKVTLVPVGKAGVLFVELILIGFSIYGCTQVTMDFRYQEWFIRDDSYLHEAFAIERDYFLGNQVPFHAVTREAYPDAHFHNQLELLQFAQSLRYDPHVAQTPPIRFWFEDLVAYAQQVAPPTAFQNPTFLSPEAFISTLHQFLDGPGKFYSSDIIFNSSGTGIRSARVSAFTTGIGSGWSAVHTVDSIRETVGDAAPELDPIAYSYGFLYYDGYRVIAWETTRNVTIAAVAVFLVTLIILANFLACFSVLCMVALTDLMLFGAMWYLGLTFNCVTCICMVLAVGIAVDYSVHIAHSFLVVSGDRRKRAEAALCRIGGAVLNGAFTTGLAIVVLAFADHYIFQTFFQMFFAIVICGVWHGLVVLPVVLSLIGPAPYITHDS